MVTHRQSCIAVLSAWAALTALGGVTVMDQFTMATGNLEGGGDGLGFAAAWDDAAATPAITVAAGSLTSVAYSSRGFVADGNKANSPVGAGANLDWTAGRQLATALDMNSNATYYFSWLVLGSWTNQSVKRGWNVGFSTVSNNLTGALSVKNLYNTGNLSTANGGTEFGPSVSNVLANGKVLFVVGKIQALSNGSDTVLLKTFADSNTVPVTEIWDVSNAVASAASLGYFVVAGRVNDGGSYYNFDEVRVGESWNDVTQVPEAGWLLGAGVLALIVHRRRG